MVKVVEVRFEAPNRSIIPASAPAPRLHYLTFWKKVGRLAYKKHVADVKERARLLALQVDRCIMAIEM